MVMRTISLYLLLGQLIIAAEDSDRELQQNETIESRCQKPACINETYANNSSDCQEAFQVSINSTGSSVTEGSGITLTCVHNIPNLNLTLGWQKDGEEIQKNANRSELILKKVFSENAGQYVCYVNNSCGHYRSPPHDVKVSNNSLLILVISGIAALVLVVTMGLAMKFKLKRDNANHKARREQRAQAARAASPAPFTPRDS